MTYRIKVATVGFGLLFLFALGVQAGILLRFMESDRNVLKNLRSLEETANDLIPR